MNARASSIPPTHSEPPATNPHQRVLAWGPEELLDLLVAAGAVGAERLPELRARVRKLALETPAPPVDGGPQVVLPPDPVALVARLGLRDERSDARLDETRLVEVVARQLHVETRPIDAFAIDPELVKRTMTRSFARYHCCLPLVEEDDHIDLALANPLDHDLVETLRGALGRTVRPVLVPRSTLLTAIDAVYGFDRSLSAAVQQTSELRVDIGNLEQLVKLGETQSIEAGDQPVVQAVERLLFYAYDQRASDIHFEPKRDRAIVRMRIDGVLHEVISFPRVIHPAIVSRIKVLARLDVAEKRRPQDGRIRTQSPTGEVELRVSTVPVAHGEKVVLRIFDPGSLLQSVSDLGFFDDERAQFDRWLARPTGLVLVTGPTGSGKTTTLYSALAAIARPELNVVTVEDPIELVHERFNQIAIQPAIDLTFSTALRHVLRQDPDVIMLGEIRDSDTARHAVQAALTGHLVLSTLHTNDAAAAVVRLRDLGVPPFLIGTTLLGAMAQRLVRRLCKHCSTRSPLTERELATLGVAHPEDYRGRIETARPVGCSQCRNTGYRGRSGIFEMLEITPRIAAAVTAGADTATISELARGDGMRSLREHALRKLALGVTSYDEIVRATSEDVS